MKHDCNKEIKQKKEHFGILYDFREGITFYRKNGLSSFTQDYDSRNSPQKAFIRTRALH